MNPQDPPGDGELMARWYEAGLAVPVAVNISVNNLLDAGFVAAVDEAAPTREDPPSVDVLSAPGEGRLPRLLATLERVRLLIIDDWGRSRSGHRLMPSLIRESRNSAIDRTNGGASRPVCRVRQMAKPTHTVNAGGIQR